MIIKNYGREEQKLKFVVMLVLMLKSQVEVFKIQILYTITCESRFRFVYLNDNPIFSSFAKPHT